MEDLAVIYVGECSALFSSRSFIVSGLTFRFLIHFEFIFVYSVRKCSSFILLQVVDQISQHHLLKRLSLIPNCQSRFNAGYWMLGADALGWPRGMVWGGRREEGQDGEPMYTCGGFISIFGKTNTIL